MGIESEIIEVKPDIGKKILKNVRKDWYIYILCIVTIIVCVSYYNHVQNNMDRVVENCNAFWTEQVNKVCPVLLERDMAVKPTLEMLENETYKWEGD